MALEEKNFSPVGAQARAGEVPSNWTYKSADAIATIIAAGYFNAMRDRVYAGDVVTVISSTGGTPLLTIVYFASVPRSPSAADVTLDAKVVTAV